MNIFILKTMDGNQYKITEEEYKKVLVGDGLMFFKSCGVTINKSRVESIYPEHYPDMVEDKKSQQVGFLHDGTKVKRMFGEWVDADNSFCDDRGRYQPVRLDRNYYPEVAMDHVFTFEEFEAIKSLPLEERRAKLLTAKEYRGRNNQLEAIGGLLLNAKVQVD